MTSAGDAGSHVWASVYPTIAHIADVKHEGDVIGLFKLAKKQLGASVAVFTSFVRDAASQDSYRFLLACSAAWCSTYQRNCWYTNDPALLYAATASEPRCRSTLPVSTDGQRQMMESAAEHGFRSGVVFPVPSAGKMTRLGALVIGSDDPQAFEGAGFRAVRLPGRLLAVELHEWWIRRMRDELLAEAKITAEDLQLLAFELRGERSKEIAKHLNTTSSCVDSRFQRLNTRLGVPTRAAAAKLAVEYGLL